MRNRAITMRAFSCAARESPLPARPSGLPFRGLGCISCGLSGSSRCLPGTLGSGIRCFLMACFCRSRDRGLLTSWGFSLRLLWCRGRSRWPFLSRCSA